MSQTSHHNPIPAILQTLVESSRRRVAQLTASTSIPELESKGASYVRRSLHQALDAATPAIIAEVKKASPSKGVFNGTLDPVTQAGAYNDGGCAAISVVTEPEYFLGDVGWIAAIREAVPVPVLRKDFIVDPIQVAESAAAGADAVLLIARILSATQLSELSAAAQLLGLEVLYEAHDEADIEQIAPLNPQLVGVNARDLDTFTVDTERVTRLQAHLPPTALMVAESGIEQRDQVVALARVGYRAFLVGEALLRSDDPAALLRSLRGEA